MIMKLTTLYNQTNRNICKCAARSEETWFEDIAKEISHALKCRNNIQ